MSLIRFIKERFIRSAVQRQYELDRRRMERVKTWTEHDQAMLEFYSQFLNPDDICFDIGANIGGRTKIFVKLCKLVVCAEPQSRCAAQLKELFGGNAKVQVIQAAVGSAIGTAQMAVSNASTVSSLSKDWVNAVQSSGRFGEDVKWNETESVAVTTLDHLIEQFGVPAFIKVDVEGYEMEALSGLSRAVKALSFEFTPERLNQAFGVLNHLGKLGNIQTNYALGEDMAFVLSQWISSEALQQEMAKFRGDAHSIGDIYVRFV